MAALTQASRAERRCRSPGRCHTGPEISVHWRVVAAAATASLIVAWHLTSRPASIIHRLGRRSALQRVLQEVRFKLVKDHWIEGSSVL